jgi:hypothetical protein
VPCSPPDSFGVVRGLQPVADAVQRTEAPPGRGRAFIAYGLESAAAVGGRPWVQPSSCPWSFFPLSVRCGLDHLLSKECCQLSMLTTTQLNTGYSASHAYQADGLPLLIIRSPSGVRIRQDP